MSQILSLQYKTKKITDKLAKEHCQNVIIIKLYKPQHTYLKKLITQDCSRLKVSKCLLDSR